MRVFKIPAALASQYKGSGWALAAIRDGAVVEIIYLRDILPCEEFEDSDGKFIPSAIMDTRVGVASKKLDSVGAVSIGMLSAVEFCEI